MWSSMHLCVEQTLIRRKYEVNNKYSVLNMPVDKFGRTDEKVVQHTPSVTSSIGLTMGQINNTFLRRDGGNAMTAEDFNLNKHRLNNLSEQTAADDAVT
jgi:hypothetical protein